MKFANRHPIKQAYRQYYRACRRGDLAAAERWMRLARLDGALATLLQRLTIEERKMLPNPWFPR